MGSRGTTSRLQLLRVAGELGVGFLQDEVDNGSGTFHKSELLFYSKEREGPYPFGGLLLLPYESQIPYIRISVGIVTVSVIPAFKSRRCVHQPQRIPRAPHMRVVLGLHPL